jgi:hypothetical protein
LCVEELGARIVPAALSTTPAPAILESFAIVQPAQTQNALAGQGQGEYERLLVPGPMGGGLFRLQGSATLGQLGNVTVSGFVHPPGSLGHGHASGSLTLSNAYGSVTLALEGPLQTGLSSLPDTFQFHVVSGTGNYTNFTDQGTVHLNLTATGKYNGTFSFSI